MSLSFSSFSSLSPRLRTRRWSGRARVSVLCSVALLASVAGWQWARAQTGATFVVNSTGDQGDATPGDGVCGIAGNSGTCTLRAALQEANALAGTDTINFNIPTTDTGRDATTGIFTITPASALPSVTGPITLNAYSQTGSKANTLSIGSDAVRLITLKSARISLQSGSDGSTIRGLTVSNFSGGGVTGSDSSNNTVVGCALDAGGGGYSAILIFSGDNYTIGGTAPADRNVLDSLDIRGSGTKVQGNYIGTGPQGTTGDFGNGIQISGSNNVIGGTEAGAGNLIAGNYADAISIFSNSSTAADNNTIQNNIIGLNVQGTAAIPNYGDAINVTSFAASIANTRIIGNVIAGNEDTSGQSEDGGNGVVLYGKSVTSTLVSGNTIGLNKARTSFIPNAGSGILVIGAASDPPTRGNVFTQNFIAGNGKLGIDLVGNGVTANDTGDADTGPNNEQNFPVLASVTGTTTSTTIAGTLNSLANTNFHIEFFANLAADTSGNGEGQTYLGFTNVTTAANGNATINVTLPVALPTNQGFVTATATRLNGTTSVETSEFSAAKQATGNGSCSTVVTNANDSGAGSLRAALTCANASAFASTVTFNIPGATTTVKTINLTTPLPSVTVPLVLNGFSQPGSNPYTVTTPPDSDADPFPVSTTIAPALRVELNGAGAGANANGLVFEAGSEASDVRGLVINRFAGNGLVLRSDNSTVAGCYIGTNATATAALSNGVNGVFIDGGSGNTFGVEEDTGGDDVAEVDKTFYNVISANTSANVRISAKSGVGGNTNRLLYNLIGTDGTVQTSTLGNGSTTIIGAHRLGGGTGVVIDGANNQIGNNGDTLIAGNTSVGVDIVRGSGNTIRDYISDNGSHGVLVGSGGAANNNAISANIINNGGDGVRVLNGTGNKLTVTTYNNAGLGIDLGGDGVTANDAKDPDTGSNLRQNFPIITSVKPGASLFSADGVIAGTLNSTPDTTFTINFYQSQTPDASGYGEGQSAVSSGSFSTPLTTTTGAQGNATFSFNVIGPNKRYYVTATATDPNGNTSEYAAPVQAVNAAKTFIVNSTADAADPNIGDGTCGTGGVCTLRAAIQEANASIVSQDVIKFNIPNTDAGRNANTGVFTITPATTLPSLTDGVTIDGYTQLGATPNNLSVGDNAKILIELNGGNKSGVPVGLYCVAGSQGSIIRGLAINNFAPSSFGDGIILDGGSVTIGGCFIGLNAAGTTAQPNAFGISCSSDSNTIGSTALADRNILSGNTSHGITAISNGVKNNQIINNYIGTNASGTGAIANGTFGINFYGNGNVIGGTTAAARNVISGNARSGVLIGDTSTVSESIAGGSNTIQNNYIGLNAAGTAALANGATLSPSGIQYPALSVATDTNRIEANVISGNVYNGIGLVGPNANTNQIVGNIIGLNATQTAALGNGANGIAVIGGTKTVSGTTTPTLPGMGNTFSQNLISGNGKLGLELGGTPQNSGDGVTANDTGDTDTGANNLQNFPVITSAAGTSIQGTLNAKASTSYKIEFFANDAADASGYGEGQTYLGFVNATTGADGNTATFSFTSSVSVANRFITATVTDPSGNTSEFAKTVAAGTVAKINTTAILMSSLNPSTSGQSVTFTATVTPASGTTKPTGAVTFKDGATTLGTGALDGTGKATFATAALSVGTHSITAIYAGDASFNGSTSAALSQVVNAASALPTLSINDVSVTEGNSGFKNATFTVTLSKTPTATVTVKYTTESTGTATVDSDYNLTSGSLTFAANTTTLTQTINVPIVGETIVEPNETFPLNLSEATNATLADAQGIGTIVNDDTAPVTPTLSINDVRITEGNADTSNANFTITLSKAATSAITVNYATANGTATGGSDYTTKTGTLTFAANTTSLTQTVAVPIAGDTAVEPDETFFFNLSGATNATIADAQGIGTIVNDDSAPTLAINDVSVVEGNSGTTSATFTVTLSRAPTTPVTVKYATANGTATAGSDYTATSGTLTFAANTTALTQTINVPISGDTVREDNETFTVVLSTPTNATLADVTGLATITNDDSFADLQVTQTIAPDTIPLNGRTTITLTVKNNGPDTAQNVVVTDTLPGSVTYVSSSGGTPTVEGKVVTFALGAITSGTTRTLTIIVQVGAQPGSLTNIAVVSGTGAPDTNTANNTSIANAQVVNGPQDVTAQVKIKLGSLTPVGSYTAGNYGNSGRYVQTVTITNKSGAAITGPLSLVLDGLTAKVTLQNSSGITSGTTPAGSPYINLSSGSDGVLSNGESASVTLQFRADGSAKPKFTPRVLAGPGTR